MDIKEFKKVKVVNVSHSRIVTHAFSLAHEEKAIIKPTDFDEMILNDLNIFHERGLLEFVPVEDEEIKKKPLIEKHTETVRTANGKEHVIFKPQDKLINVEAIDTTGKAIDVAFSKMDAVELLGKHWKTLEKEIEKIDKLDDLKLILATAKELDMEGNKKFDIVKNRLGALE